MDRILPDLLAPFPDDRLGRVLRNLAAPSLPRVLADVGEGPALLAARDLAHGPVAPVHLAQRRDDVLDDGRLQPGVVHRLVDEGVDSLDPARRLPLAAVGGRGGARPRTAQQRVDVGRVLEGWCILGVGDGNVEDGGRSNLERHRDVLGARLGYAAAEQVAQLGLEVGNRAARGVRLVGTEQRLHGRSAFRSVSKIRTRSGRSSGIRDGWLDTLSKSARSRGQLQEPASRSRWACPWVRGGGGAWVLAAPRIARPAIAAKSRKPSCRFPDADRWERVEFECRLRGLVPVWGRIVHTYCVTR